jgi:hypothetical protein
MHLVSRNQETIVGRIYSAQAKLVIDHGLGRLTIQLRYCEGVQKVVVQIESVSAEFEQDFREYSLQLPELCLFMDHVKKILSEGMEREPLPER